MQLRYLARFSEIKLVCLAIGAPLALLPVAAYASFYSGDELYKVCTAQRGSTTYVENTYECIAYITGTIDAFNTIRRTNKLKSCIPEDVTIAQLRKATVTYLADNPKTRNAPASELVFAATRKEWPCTTKK
ncbi:Rap1a/Tai family immunity protein [Novosphingobium kaempferiae]|uniref:Rap1a/Tai family immunity protein n=1 Tax=Novosphingobium kaempferiae TaxID=2896849 RepID=UPI001E290086|nr:Rap1a/Tai family immunity protein [Novosphingobium kaempferiae]